MTSKYLCAFVLLVSLNACAGHEAGPAGCAVPSHIETKLFFGLSRPDGTSISTKDWQDFVASDITTQFAEGFTILSGLGGWRDSQSGDLLMEDSRIVIRLHDGTKSDETGIRTIIETYKTRFDQTSVLRADIPVCAIF